MTIAQHLIKSALIALTETNESFEEWKEQHHIQISLKETQMTAENIWDMASCVCYPFKVEWETEAFKQGYKSGVQFARPTGR